MEEKEREIMYKETKYVFCDRPYYQIKVTRHSITNTINIEFQLAKDDDFIIEITQVQAAVIATELAKFAGMKIADKNLNDYNIKKKKEDK